VRVKLSLYFLGCVSLPRHLTGITPAKFKEAGKACVKLLRSKNAWFDSNGKVRTYEECVVGASATYYTEPTDADSNFLDDVRARLRGDLTHTHDDEQTFTVTQACPVCVLSNALYKEMGTQERITALEWSSPQVNVRIPTNGLLPPNQESVWVRAIVAFVQEGLTLTNSSTKLFAKCPDSAWDFDAQRPLPRPTELGSLSKIEFSLWGDLIHRWNELHPEDRVPLRASAGGKTGGVAPPSSSRRIGKPSSSVPINLDTARPRQVAAPSSAPPPLADGSARVAPRPPPPPARGPPPPPPPPVAPPRNEEVEALKRRIEELEGKAKLPVSRLTDQQAAQIREVMGIPPPPEKDSKLSKEDLKRRLKASTIPSRIVKGYLETGISFLETELSKKAGAEPAAGPSVKSNRLETFKSEWQSVKEKFKGEPLVYNPKTERGKKFVKEYYRLKAKEARLGLTKVLPALGIAPVPQATPAGESNKQRQRSAPVQGSSSSSAGKGVIGSVKGTSRPVETPAGPNRKERRRRSREATGEQQLPAQPPSTSPGEPEGESSGVNSTGPIRDLRNLVTSLQMLSVSQHLMRALVDETIAALVQREVITVGEVPSDLVAILDLGHENPGSSKTTHEEVSSSGNDEPLKNE